MHKAHRRRKLLMNKAAQLPPEDRVLGPNAKRFADHLDAGLEMFGLDFKDFNPRFGVHEEHGMSLVFNQIDPNHFEEYDLSLKKDWGFDDLIVAVDEKAVRYPAVEHAAIYPFEPMAGFVKRGTDTNENSPEYAALMFLTAIVKKKPIPPMICEQCECENEEKE